MTCFNTWFQHRSTIIGYSLVIQWFPNFLASDPKEKLNICPGPKLVKTADLQAEIGFLIYGIYLMFLSFLHEITDKNH